MSKIILVFVLCLTSALSVQAQSFEGVVEMTREMATGISYEITWYIKGDKIAYDLKARDEAGTAEFHFVPRKDKGTIEINMSGSTFEVAISDIKPLPGFDTAGLMAEQKGDKLIVSTANSLSEIEINKEVNFNFSGYTDYFKSDYGVSAMAKLNLTGFPGNSLTKDKAGNILSTTTIRSIKKQKVSSSHF